MNTSMHYRQTIRIALIIPVLLAALLATMSQVEARSAGKPSFSDMSFAVGITGATYDCAYPKGNLATGASRWLSGVISSDGTSALVHNWSESCTIQVGLASYKVFDFNTDSSGNQVLDTNGNPIPRLSTQELYDSTTTSIGPGQTLELNVNIPSCMAQVDLFYGDLIVSFAGGERYSPRLLNNITTGSELCDRDGACTLTPGFWKTHPESWPVQSLQIGNNTYNQAELQAMLWKSTNGNGLTNLARHLIAAKLNTAMGTDPSAVSSAIAEADAMIGGLVPPPIGSDSLKTSAVSSLVSILDNYNNGVIGPGHCN